MRLRLGHPPLFLLVFSPRAPVSRDSGIFQCRCLWYASENKQTKKTVGVRSSLIFFFTDVEFGKVTCVACVSIVVARQNIRRCYHRNTDRSEPESHWIIQEYGRYMLKRHWGMWTICTFTGHEGEKVNRADTVRLLDWTRALLLFDQ